MLMTGKFCKIILTAALTIMIFTVSAQAQSDRTENRSHIGIRIGYFDTSGETKTSGSIVENSCGMQNMSISLLYGHGVSERTMFNLAISVLAGDCGNRIAPSGVTNSQSGVVSVLAGLKYYLTASEHASAFRPYIYAGIGPYIANENYNEVGTEISNRSHTMTAFGCNLGIGTDIFTGGRFVFSAQAGYNLAGDFPEPVAGRKNFSGFELNIGFGILLGGGKKVHY